MTSASTSSPGRRRASAAMTATALAAVALLAVCLWHGSVDIPASEVWAALTGGHVKREAWRVIVIETRLPMALTAILAGAGLSVAGLLLQTTFNNPLAGPSILGVSTGASLGVAVVMLLFGGAAGMLQGSLGALAGAIAGAAVVMMMLLAMSKVVSSGAMLLIAGIMVGYLASSAISLMSFFASAQGIQGYVVWGLGSFSSTGFDRLGWLGAPVIAALLGSLPLIKPMDALLLGERYAASMGVNVKAARGALLTVSGALTAFVTAFCGPVGFIGLAVPHMARFLTSSSAHSTLVPATMLTGAATGLLCAALTVMPSTGLLPVNAITPLIGVPVILYIIIRRRRLHYFN